MKIFLVLLVICFEFLFASMEKIEVNKSLFLIEKENYNEYGNKGEVMRLYKGEDKNESSLLLTFILKDRTGPCSARELQKGTYEINGTMITLYSSWKRGGKAYEAPSGVRVQIYKVLDNSNLEKLSSRLYIETTRQGYDEESGMKYLFKEPMTAEEKESLREYIDEVEEEYHGVFVREEEAKELKKEVRKAFRRETKALWSKRE
jgi:hypothetical protein